MSTNQKETTEDTEKEMKAYTTEELNEFMGHTIDAVQSLLHVVRKIKKDHYDSKDDELDVELEDVVNTISYMLDFI